MRFVNLALVSFDFHSLSAAVRSSHVDVRLTAGRGRSYGRDLNSTPTHSQLRAADGTVLVNGAL